MSNVIPPNSGTISRILTTASEAASATVLPYVNKALPYVNTAIAGTKNSFHELGVYCRDEKNRHVVVASIGAIALAVVATVSKSVLSAQKPKVSPIPKNDPQQVQTRIPAPIIPPANNSNAAGRQATPPPQPLTITPVANAANALLDQQDPQNESLNSAKTSRRSTPINPQQQATEDREITNVVTASSDSATTATAPTGLGDLFFRLGHVTQNPNNVQTPRTTSPVENGTDEALNQLVAMITFAERRTNTGTQSPLILTSANTQERATPTSERKPSSAPIFASDLEATLNRASAQPQAAQSSTNKPKTEKTPRIVIPVGSSAAAGSPPYSSSLGDTLRRLDSFGSDQQPLPGSRGSFESHNRPSSGGHDTHSSTRNSTPVELDKVDPLKPKPKRSRSQSTPLAKFQDQTGLPAVVAASSGPNVDWRKNPRLQRPREKNENWQKRLNKLDRADQAKSGC